MRFTTKSQLPPNLHPQNLKELEECFALLSADIEKGSLLGFDTETSGLESDGLDVLCHYVCLSTINWRAAIPTSGEFAKLMRPVADFLIKTQDLHCGYNIIYDWNVLYGYTAYQLKWEEPLDLQRCYADGFTLINRFDEEGEETYKGRSLKDRARYYVGIPMAEFDWILNVGGVVEAMAQDPVKALDYCTRDGYCPVAVVTQGAKIAAQLEWCESCPECGKYMYTIDRESGLYECVDHGPREGHPLTILDWHRELDVPFLKVLQNMQRRGITIDVDYLESITPDSVAALVSEKQKFLRETRAAIAAKGQEPWDVNPKSADHLKRYLFRTLGLKALSKTKSGGEGTSRKDLKNLLVMHNPPGLHTLMKMRDLDKVFGTFVTGLQKTLSPNTGRLHGRFRPETATGRLASQNPNLQNIPARDLELKIDPVLELPSIEYLVDTQGFDKKEAEAYLEELADNPSYQEKEIKIAVRKAIIAKPGYKLVNCDYAQLEVRLTAIESGDPDLIGVINNGIDMHCYTASKAFTSAIPWLDYELIYEATRWKDGDKSYRLAACQKMADNPQEAYGARLSFLSAKDKEVAGRCLALSKGHEDWESFEESIPLEDREQFVNWMCVDDKRLKNLRSSAKSAIFGIIYGIGPTGLAVQITDATGEVCDPKFARELIHSIKYQIFPGIGKMLDRYQYTLKTYGFVRTRMGRYRHPAATNSGDPGARARALRQSMNSPIQGLASDVVQMAMIAIEKDTRLNEMGFELLLQVHDELMGQVPEEHADEALEIMSDIMRTAHGMVTPVLLDVSGDTAYCWSDAK